MVNPPEDLRMPDQGVLAIRNPMVLIRVVQEPRRHALLLEHIEEHHTLGHRQSIIKVAVNDEVGRLPLAREEHGVAVVVGVSGDQGGLVEGALEVVRGEPQLVGRVLV